MAKELMLLLIDTVLQEEHTPIRNEEGGWGAFATFMSNLLLADIMLTCRRNCGSSCGRLSEKDCLVHAGESVVSEGRRQSDT